MARAKVVHSTDGVTVVFKGNPKSPEPSLGVIRFAGGLVEVSRCSDNSYYAHIYIDEGAEILNSRVDYDPEYAQKHNIPDIPDRDHVRKIAIRVKGGVQ